MSKKNKLGLVALTSIVAGNMMGSGIFMLPANLAQIGSISLWGWITTTIGVLGLALIFSVMATLLPKAGGPYAYVKECYGDYLGFQTVYIYWLAAWIGNIAISIVSVGYLSYFIPALKDPWLGCLANIAIIWFFTLVNAFGPRTIGKLQIATTTALLIPILSLSIIGIFWFSPHIFHSAYNVSGLSNWSAISTSASFTLWAFIGVESAAVSAGVVENPQRNIPLATFLGVLLAGVAYILSSVIIMGIVPNGELTQSSSPFSLMAEYILGPAAAKWVSGCAILACFGTLAGWTLLVGQSAKAAADDGLFPAIFSKVNRYNVPVLGLVVVATMMTVILLFTISSSLTQQFERVGLTTVFLCLLIYLYCSATAIVLSYRYRMRKKYLIWIAGLAFITLIYTFWALINVGQEIIYYGALILLTSVPFYIIVLWRKRRMAPSVSKEAT